MSRLIIANWKLNPETLEEAESIVSNIKLPKYRGTDVVIMPPLVFLEELAKKYPQFSWGAQDFFFEDTGPYTGEISLPMLKSIGVNWVLVGHSDRRQKFGETDEVVNKKIKQALREGFFVVLAVGELKDGSEDQIVESLLASTEGIRPEEACNMFVAYEPVWAISSTKNSKPDTPSHVEKIISRLKKVFDTRYIYGGSVNEENAADFLAIKQIEGALVGSASLSADSFSKIINLNNLQ